MPEDTEKLSNNGLDKANENNESDNVSENNSHESIINERDSTINKKRRSQGIKGILKKKALIINVAVGLYILLGAGHIFLEKERLIGFLMQGSINSDEKSSHTKKMLTLVNPTGLKQENTLKAKMNENKINQSLPFKPFIITLDKHKNTYIFLTFYIEVPNNELRLEIMEKKCRLRGIIYDILTREVNKAKEIPLLNNLREAVIQAIGEALPNKNVKKIYITEFMIV